MAKKVGFVLSFFFLMWGLFLIHEWECNVFLLQNVVETMFLRNVLNHNPELLEQKLRVWGQPSISLLHLSVLSICPGAAQIIPLFQRMQAIPQDPFSSDSGGHRVSGVELGTWRSVQHFPDFLKLGVATGPVTGSFPPFLLAGM